LSYYYSLVVAVERRLRLIKDFWQKLLPKKNYFMGVDVGIFQIKAAEIKVIDNFPEVFALRRYPSPPGLWSDQFDEESLVEALREVTNPRLEDGHLLYFHDIIVVGDEMKIENPHDKFFKEIFGKVEVAKDFLNNYLPENIMKVIDVDTLEPQKDSFIYEELQEVFSDMLFKVNINNREGYVYILFEHKSYTSKDIAFQLLKYMLEIWEAKIKKEKTYKLPVIIPLVIYHGKDRWNIRTTLGELITGYEELPKDIQKFIPDYVFSARTNLTRTDVDEIIEKIEETYPEGSEVIMTLIERIREEGKEEGILTGMELGARQNKAEVAKNLIKINLTIEQITEATGLPKKEVEKIAAEMGH
jgi:predicted transposase YdaD